MHVCAFLGLLLAVMSSAESRQEKSLRSERMIRPPYWPQPWMNTTAAGLYNSTTEKCCLGSVHLNKKPSYDKCCGSGMMDSSKELCCNDAIVPLVPGESCCGQKTINTDNAICCDNEEAKIDPKVIPFAKCCGKKAFDGRSQTCCNNNNILDGANLQCCGDKSYEYGKQACCMDYTNGMTTYRVLPTSDALKTSCCGNTVYNPSTEFCCGGNAVANSRSCCDDKSDYDPTTHACCNKQLTEKNKKNIECCVENFYDSSNEICCYGYTDDGNLTETIVTKTDTNQTECCGIEPYDAAKQLCCDETKKIIPKSKPDHYQCCGDVSYGYGYDNGLCCNDVFYSDAKMETHDCCGGKPMDRNENICCGDEIVASSDSQMCCDSTDLYNWTTQLCCGAYDASGTNYVYSVVEKTGDNDQCCGLKAYDMEEEFCCGSQVISNSDNTGCCGNKAYNTEEEFCCNDATLFPKENGRDTCCLYGTTDTKSDYPYCPPYPVYY